MSKGEVPGVRVGIFPWSNRVDTPSLPLKMKSSRYHHVAGQASEVREALPCLSRKGPSSQRTINGFVPRTDCPGNNRIRFPSTPCRRKGGRGDFLSLPVVTHTSREDQLGDAIDCIWLASAWRLALFVITLRFSRRHLSIHRAIWS